MPPILFDILVAPLTHGVLGIVDEILLYCMPVVVALVVLAISARRARAKDTLERTRKDRRRPPKTIDSEHEAK